MQLIPLLGFLLGTMALEQESTQMRHRGGTWNPLAMDKLPLLQPIIDFHPIRFRIDQAVEAVHGAQSVLLL